VRTLLGRDDPAAARVDLATACDLVLTTLDEARAAIGALRPPVLDDLGLPAALSWLARTLEQRTGLAVVLSLEGLGEDLDPDLATLVFRLVQEALTNVLRHAGVASAEVAVCRRARALELRVVDGGRGFDTAAVLGDPEAVAGSGLRGMRDRLELFGGRLEIASTPGGGTTVAATVPLLEAAP
jgi:two-component system sensor histidine kinase UhpB